MGVAMEQPSTSVIRPQPGSQESFLATPADVAVYGGAAGAGKSYALLMEPLRFVGNPRFGAVVFRRTYPQITNEGGLWDTSQSLYRACGARAKESNLEWTFQSGARVKFAHMQHEDDRFAWDGAQIPFIGFDQLEHFTWRQFFYMFSRNRTTCGVVPYMRATCNPDPDHWLREFMRWWIDDDTGLPVKERGGVIRWFVVLNDVVHWGDSLGELKTRFGEDVTPKSFTFVPGNVRDNLILMRENPEYLANLKAMQKVDRERLLGGNWNIRETAGTYFQRTWFEVVDAAPASVSSVRYWDRAATPPVGPGKPAKASWTVGLKMSRDARGVFYVEDVVRFQGRPLEVERGVRNTASQDAKRTTAWLEGDPGQAGKAEAEALARVLAGYDVRINPVRENKGARAKPYSAQAEAGNVKLVRAPWNEAFLQEHENFDGTPNCVSDQVDAGSGAFHVLTTTRRAGTWGRRR